MASTSSSPDSPGQTVGRGGDGPLYELAAEITVEDGGPLRVGETVVLHLD